MSNHILQASVFFIGLCGVLGTQTAVAKKTYRWTDDKGNVHVSDHVPPEHVQYRRDSLNKKGRVLEVIEKAKSKEQIMRDNQLADLRKEQEKLISNQKMHDKALLSTFRSKEDMLATLNARFETLDTEKKIIAGNLEELKTLLSWQQKQAALIERDGKKISQKSLAEMQSTQNQIKKTEHDMLVNLTKRQQVEIEYKADIDRFVSLTESAQNTNAHKTANIIEANKLGLFYCNNDHQCNKAWDIGHKFVNFYSTTQPDVYNEKLIMNRPPAIDSDLSLSLSKIKLTETDYQLFLDIRCRDSSQGRELCAGSKVASIRAAFRPYINNALARTTQK